MRFDIRSQGLWIRSGIQIRWAIIFGAALMTFDLWKNPLIAGAIGLFALSNIGLLLYLKAKAADEETVANTVGYVRFFDGIAVISLGFLPALHNERIWLLGIPVLIVEAMSNRNRPRVAAMAGAMILVQLGVESVGRFQISDAVLPIGVLGGSAALGLVLASFKEREDRLTSRDHRLGTVLDCGTALAATRDLKATIVHTLKAAVGETGASCGYVMLLDDEGKGPLVTEAAYSVEGEFDFPETLDVGFGLSGYVAKMGQPIAVSDESEEHQGYDGVTAGVHSAISVPLVSRGGYSVGKASEEQVLGTLTLLSTHKRQTFSGDDIDLLRTLSSLISVAVSNARMEERQQSTFVRTMESLATALEARDEYTQGHSQRVCEVSLMLGEKMGFSQEAMEELRIGTVLHDIGKIGVPDSILNKRARLTDEEFVVMKQHPVIGFEICKPLMLSEGVLMIIRNHHEKLDGSGYPDGLKGGELPLSLRIVCLADAFDAMSSTRPYRGVMSLSSVLSEISRGAGTQFDPVVVEALKELLTHDRMRELYAKNLVEEGEVQAA